MERNRAIDIAKGLSILGMLVVHMKFEGLYALVAGYCVTIFYFVSGYFFKAKEDTKKMALVKAKRLLTPYFATCLVIMLFAIFFNIVITSDESMGQVILRWLYAIAYAAGDPYEKPFVIPHIGGIWFLWAMLWGSIFLNMILKLKKKWQVFWIVFLFIVGVVTTKICWFPLNIQAGLTATGFMYVGYLAKDAYKYYMSLKQSQKNLIIVFCFVVYAIFVYKFEEFWPVHNEYAHGPLDLAACLCIAVCIMVISSFIDKHSGILASFLATCGKYSLVILCVHIIELDVFPWEKVAQIAMMHGMTDYVAHAILIRLCKVVWIVCGTYICTRINFIRDIFGLKRLELVKKNEA